MNDMENYTMHCDLCVIFLIQKTLLFSSFPYSNSPFLLFPGEEFDDVLPFHTRLECVQTGFKGLAIH